MRSIRARCFFISLLLYFTASLLLFSAADVNGAEAEDDVAAGGGPAEAEHGTEAGEEQHLIELVPKIRASGTRQNLIANHLAVGIDGYIEKQAMREREFRVVLFPGLREVGERDEFSGLQDVDGHIVLNGANGDARHHQLQHDGEYQDGGYESTSGRHSQ